MNAASGVAALGTIGHHVGPHRQSTTNPDAGDHR